MTAPPPPFRQVGEVAAGVVAQVAGPVAIERITVKPIRPGFAFIDLRLPGVHLHGIEAHRDDSDAVTLKAPERADRDGRLWPVFNLQPGVLEAAARETARLWAMNSPRRDSSVPPERRGCF